MNYSIDRDTLTLEKFLTLREESGLGKINAELVRRALDGSLMTFTAEFAGKTVGMLRVAGDGGLVYVIYDVLVHPDYRLLGIGSALTGEALSAIKASLPTDCYVQVALFASEGREGFYKRFGFIEMPCKGMGAGMVTFVKGS